MFDFWFIYLILKTHLLLADDKYLDQICAWDVRALFLPEGHNKFGTVGPASVPQLRRHIRDSVRVHS